jgi:hypothetical protein
LIFDYCDSEEQGVFRRQKERYVMCIQASKPSDSLATVKSVLFDCLLCYVLAVFLGADESR